MVMLNAKIERDEQGRVAKIGGEIKLLRKIRPDKPDGKPEYKILEKKRWRRIGDIEEYVEKYNMIVYKLNSNRQ